MFLFSKCRKLAATLAIAAIFAGSGTVFAQTAVEQATGRTVEDYTRIIAQEPDNAEAYFKRSALYFVEEKYSLAIADCTQAIKLGFDQSLVYYIRGVSYGLSHEMDSAIADMEHFCEIEPRDATGKEFLADFYCLRGTDHINKDKNNVANIDLAIADFDHALRIIPHNRKTYELRGGAYGAKAILTHDAIDIECGISDLECAVQLGSKDSDVQKLLSLLYGMRNSK